MVLCYFVVVRQQRVVMDFTPDVCMAKRSCDGDGFSAYSRAYINTNEKLRLSMKYMPKNCNKALVCTASGDHALFASLYGAERVDVFDVSYNAKCIIDMKVAALNCLNREEYSEFLDDL